MAGAPYNANGLQFRPLDEADHRRDDPEQREGHARQQDQQDAVERGQQVMRRGRRRLADDGSTR